MAKKRPSLKQELNKALSPRQGYERSKHLDKQLDHQEYIRFRDAGLEHDKMQSREKYYFHSKNTYNETLMRGVKCWRWINEYIGHRIPLEEVPAHLNKYLDYRKELAERGEISARTLAKERSQLSKCFLVNTDNYKILLCSSESDKGRSVSIKWSDDLSHIEIERQDGFDRHYNHENHRSAVEFYAMTGARQAEYHYMNVGEVKHYAQHFKQVLAERLPGREFELYRDEHGRIPNIQPIRNSSGTVCAVVICHAKHGKTNYSEILPEHRERLTAIFDSGEYHRYMNPSDHANVHACRRAYAQAFYNKICRPIEDLSEKEIYRTRDGTHRAYDREAVGRVAKSLGHKDNDEFDTIHKYLR